MKRHNYLKGLRVLLAILFFVPILFYFIDFSHAMPSKTHTLLHLQILPAILSYMGWVLVLHFLLALLFGRIYCSVICPTGVLQDIINRVYCIGKKKNKGVQRFSYHKPQNLFRYTLLGVTATLGVLGLTGLCMLLDPYSNFGRIASNLFRPVVIIGNNLLAEVLMKMDNYSLYQVTISTVTNSGLIAAVIALAAFIVMVAFRGRLFCNTLCPIGAWLSLISRYSIFRISFDKTACTNCGSCERACKAEAINGKDLRVDSSRCVDCFNCVSSCAKGALKYRYRPFFRKDERGMASAKPDKVLSLKKAAPANGRRSFLTTGATITASLPIISTLAEKAENPLNKSKHKKKWPPITPPGSINLERFKDKCTACHLCVVQCPSQVLRPAGLEYGFDYLLKPRLAYVNSYCNYECTVCSEVCPTHAITSLTKEEKATTQVGIAKFFIDRCIVKVDETDCGACSEHCPTQAVHMIAYKGTLTIPHVEPDLCIGCGGCESICPVRPMRAIIIKSNKVHQYVEKPKEEEAKKVEVEDFGF